MHVHVADIGLTVSCIMSMGFGEKVSDCALLQRARAPAERRRQRSHSLLSPTTLHSSQSRSMPSTFIASATVAGWHSVLSSHLYHCRRRRRPGYQLMGRHPLTASLPALTMPVLWPCQSACRTLPPRYQHCRSP